MPCRTALPLYSTPPSSSICQIQSSGALALPLDFGEQLPRRPIRRAVFGSDRRAINWFVRLPWFAGADSPGANVNVNHSSHHYGRTTALSRECSQSETCCPSSILQRCRKRASDV
jgi:hypothetical protein